ncbi:MAG TPA: hypothetical protein VLY21_06750 [Nitrososphaerales archaeon]|nr:hypothetical protein [Nitrososphaerales archaeon]
MLDEIINEAQYPIYLLGLAIFLFATYRAFTIARVLVKGAYRNRALWTGGTAFALILFEYATTLPASNPLGISAFFLILLILFAFVDSSIRVAQETDFFHRSPLGWQRLRKPLYGIILGYTGIGALLILIIGSTVAAISLTGEVLWFIIAGVSLTYSAAALVVGARRTPERSLRRFVRMLGLTIICMVLFFTAWIPFIPFSQTVQDFGSLVSEVFIPLAAYFLYLAVMSLSPVGRVEEAPAQPSAQAGASVKP